jgi:NitT/TauT family transport system ATP-binding protein
VADSASLDGRRKVGESYIVEAKGLKFSFQKKPIIDGISFSIKPGQFVSFIGPSGCGKTTLLHIVAGIYKGYAGELSVATDRISFVFQQDALLAWRTALANVLLPFELKGVPLTDALQEKGRRLLAALGLSGYEDFAPAQLSGGMKKRVELARALVTDPELLILDEPFSSLDIMTRERLNILIRRIREITRCTVVMVTHSVEEACFLSEKIYVLSNLPARIINLKTISKNGSKPGLYTLSPAEAKADSDIRKKAKVLWTVLHEPEEVQETVPPTPRKPIERIARFVRRHYAGLLIPFELAAIFILVVFLKNRIPIPDYIFPSPLGTVTRFFQTLFSGSILPDLGITVYESLLGFLIAFALTLVLGYGIAKSKVIGGLLMPYLIAANTIPSVALAPFLVLWLGFGITPRVVTSVIVIFFPMLINNISAIELAGRSMQNLIDFFRPSRMRRFIYFELPASLPYIASGVKVSITLSVIGAVVGEFVSGDRGLGALVGIAKANFDIELMFVGLIWLMALGLIYYVLAHFLSRLVARRIH